MKKMKKPRNTPIFVKLDEYEDIVNIMNIVQRQISQAKNLLNKVADLKSQEDIELEKWYADISEVENKIKWIDSTLFEHSD